MSGEYAMSGKIKNLLLAVSASVVLGMPVKARSQPNTETVSDKIEMTGPSRQVNNDQNGVENNFQ